MNTNNKERMAIFSSFLEKHSLSQVTISHKTYHHFLGGGAFDSNIDIIVEPKDSPCESIITIYCKHDYPQIDSHHDVILSSISIPVSDLPSPPDDLITAPRLDIHRHKILWYEEGIGMYKQLVAKRLSEIRMRWLEPSSKTSLSVLLASTNDILSRSALASNKSVDLSKPIETKSEKKPAEIRHSETLLKKVHRSAAKNDTIKQARRQHRSLVRAVKVRRDMKQDEHLFSLLTSNPASAFRTIKSAKSENSVQVPYIQVGKKRYAGDRVVDGLFESISNLKSLDLQLLEESPFHSSLLEDYKNIKFLCENKVPLPNVPLSKTTEILRRIKPGVNDIFSVTANHFINAGSAGLVHFNLLLNALLIDVNNCTVEELNTVYALMLYKGHKKDRTLDSSYRTISTCPLLAKGLDIYVRDLSIDS